MIQFIRYIPEMSIRKQNKPKYLPMAQLDSASDSAFRLRNIAMRGDEIDDQYRKRNNRKYSPERQTLIK